MTIYSFETNNEVIKKGNANAPYVGTKRLNLSLWYDISDVHTDTECPALGNKLFPESLRLLTL